jgi:adenosine deaminase
LRARTFVELADKHGVPLRYDPASNQGDGWVGEAPAPVDPSDPYRFRDFRDFLLGFAAASRSLQVSEDYARLAREFVEDALAQNVVYGELFVSPSVWTFFNPDLDVREALAAIVAELRKAQPHATFALLPDLTRNFGAERAMKTARLVATMEDLDVIGISLGGDETRFPAKLFAGVFAYARAEGLKAVAHAGEADGAHSVRDAVEVLGAQRIGHGIRALDDPVVLDMLARRRIPLEICPTSNVRTGAAHPEYPHAYEAFDRAGCVVTIDADDPAMFHTSIEREYAIVEEQAGPAVLERFVRNAIDASFAPEAVKTSMRAKIDAVMAELEAAS